MDLLTNPFWVIQNNVLKVTLIISHLIHMPPHPIPTLFAFIARHKAVRGVADSYDRQPCLAF